MPREYPYNQTSLPTSLLIAVPVVPHDGKTFVRLAAGLGVGAHRISPAETGRPGGPVRAAAVHAHAS
jgi:hypothetical protein